MANAVHGTLVANVMTEVQVDDCWPNGVTIINRSGSSAGTLWYRLDQVNPVVAAADSFCCLDVVFQPHPANGAGYTPGSEAQAVKVRLISTAALAYSVEGNPPWKRV